MPTEKQLANLKPPVKGEVRNPKGKVPGTLATKTIIRRWLEAKENSINPLTKQKESLTQLDLMVLALIKKAKQRNDVNAFIALLDRMDGKPNQSMQITGDAENPVTISAVDGLTFEQLMQLKYGKDYNKQQS
jgi:hypothetical protein